MLKYKDKVVIELAGHDHWEDFRMNIDSDGNMFRNMFIATGVGLDHKQLPGFNTMKIDEVTVMPKEFKETILDVTKAYGMDTAPPLDSLPVHTIDFAKDYGLNEYSAEAIYAMIQDFEKNDFEHVLRYLSDKLGYDPTVKDQFEYGVELAANWSLINK